MSTSKPGMGFEVNIRTSDDSKQGSITHADTPFRIAILGDFSGSHVHQVDVCKPLAQRKLIAIDRDNFDEVLAGFNLQLQLSLQDQPGSQLNLDFHELDDFHPDSMYQKLDIFSRLRSLRKRLQKNDSFDAAAAEIMGWLVPEPAPRTEPPSTNADPAPMEADAPSLDDILGATQQPSSMDQEAGINAIDQLVKQVVAPYVEAAADPRQQDMLDAVDQAIAGHMGELLHHPRFQQLEAAWRSVYFLVRRLETDRHLQLYLLDVSKSELEADLAGDPAASALHKHFCEPAMNEAPWSLLLGNYRFGDTIEDALLLAQLGSLAREADAPFLAAAEETLAGCENLARYPDPDDWRYASKPGAEKAWQALRQDPVSDYLGLVLPRFLLRAPYGKKSDPIESFPLEEMAKNQHEAFLWGNGAFVKAEQLARAFSHSGWRLRPGEVSQTDGLPLFYYREEGETLLMPAAEIYLTEKGARQCLSHGLIPLFSVKNSDAIHSSDFNALSEDGKSLRGRWSSSY